MLISKRNTLHDGFRNVSLAPSYDCRFCALKLQALKGFTILPSLAAVTIPRLDDLIYFMDDLPYPQSLTQELELWKVKYTL